MALAGTARAVAKRASIPSILARTARRSPAEPARLVLETRLSDSALLLFRAQHLILFLSDYHNKVASLWQRSRGQEKSVRKSSRCSLRLGGLPEHDTLGYSAAAYLPARR